MFKNKSILVSVIIPCYNHGEFVKEAVDSVYKSVLDTKVENKTEIIIVDDGSDDTNTKGILEQLKTENNYIELITQDNKGLGNARNTGIKKAKGKFIIPLDSDNKLTNLFFTEALNKFIQNESVDIVYANAILFGEEKGTWNFPIYSMTKALRKNTLDACAIYRKKVWEELKGYDENMPYNGYEDWDFWIRAAKKGFVFKKINGNGFYYRVLKDSMIRSLSEKKRIESRVYILSKNGDLLIDDYLKYDSLSNMVSKNIFFGIIKVVGHFLKNRSRNL